jgi:RHS repeat-associated protein
VSIDKIAPQADLPKEVQAAYDAANEMIQFNSTTPNLTYDPNGNLILQTDANGTTAYNWDARNRLVAMSGSSVSASFAYDALGRRISKTINGTTTEYLYDGNDIVAEIQGGVVTTTYLRGLNIDEPFVRTSSTGQEFYHVDALGSVLAITNDAGAVQTTYRYDPFGNTTVTGTSTNPFQYTARENDGTGLYYYRARYYSPTLSRFLSEDPLYSPLQQAKKCKSNFTPSVSNYIETDRNLSQLMALKFYQFVGALGPNPQQIHLYTYTNDNPINGTDPLGLAVIPNPPAGPQNAGCDPGNWGASSPCVPKCCDAHDQCYVDNRCNAGSWVVGLVPAQCITCNTTVVKCLVRSAISSIGGGRKDGC